MEKNQRIPNFFIVGAPKSGTTALSTYLKDHDEIFMTDPKEPHYFASNLAGYQLFKTEEDYLRLFSETKSSHKAVGEASVYYLYSKDAIKNIHSFNKNAKIIIMLRDPVEMVYSLHAQLVFSANEEITDFEEAWNIIDIRKSGVNLSKNARDQKILYYDQIAKYDEQIENVYNCFPKNQVKIILFDDFKQNPEYVYKDVLKFLEVRNDNRVDFPRINENTIPKSIFLNTWLKKPPKLIEKTKDNLKKMFKIKRFKVISLIMDLNTRKGQRKELSERLYKEIYQNYAHSINRLSLLIGKNLDHWKH